MIQNEKAELTDNLFPKEGELISLLINQRKNCLILKKALLLVFYAIPKRGEK